MKYSNKKIKYKNNRQGSHSYMKAWILEMSIPGLEHNQTLQKYGTGLDLCVFRH